MSQWTHVAGIIRLDSMGNALVRGTSEADKEQGMWSAIERALGGKPTSYESHGGEDCGLPMGSQGSLQYAVARNRDHNDPALSWGYISLWGDLRDFGAEDVPALVLWLKASVRRLVKPEGFGDLASMSMTEKAIYMLASFMVRDLIVSVRVECGKTTILGWDGDNGQVISREIEE